jgi:cell wall-associated NlpC family hydrolase
VTSRFGRATGLALTLALISTVLIGQSAQASPALDRAKAKAEVLRHRLNSLQLRQSIAIERYDGIQDQLQQAVSTELTNGDQASAVSAQAQDARDAVADRARALYMSGGQLSLIATVLQGTTPGDVLERAQTVRAVMNSDHLTAATNQAAALQAQAVARASSDHRIAVATLQAQATASLVEVQNLLAQQRQLLADADRTVRRIAREEQQAAEAQALADAAASAGAAGVPTGSGGPLPATIEGPNPAATAAIAYARSKLGTPYLWGAVGPTRFDCSGLTMWSYAQAGLTIPRTSRAQYAGLPHVPLSDLQPGDLVFYATNTADPNTIHHVAMYLGDGVVIHAPHTGDVVRYAPVAMDGLIGAVRPTL